VTGREDKSEGEGGGGRREEIEREIGTNKIK
jgi:hypothetical protein